MRCEGFNGKNAYERQTPCDQDYLRKMARRTDAQLLQSWFNRKVMGIFKHNHAFDAEGIFFLKVFQPLIVCCGGEVSAAGKAQADPFHVAG